MFSIILELIASQSNKQKIAAMNFFKQTISFSPFITNVMWFTQVTPNDINGLLIIFLLGDDSADTSNRHFDNYIK